MRPWQLQSKWGGLSPNLLLGALARSTTVLAPAYPPGRRPGVQWGPRPPGPEARGLGGSGEGERGVERRGGPEA